MVENRSSQPPLCRPFMPCVGFFATPVPGRCPGLICCCPLRGVKIIGQKHELTPISRSLSVLRRLEFRPERAATYQPRATDRKSTRLNSSHLGISYAVFCLKHNTAL